MIDAHQHFWQIAAHDCSWPTANLTQIYRDFGPVDLAPLVSAAGVAGTVLVQSQESDADTDFLLHVANSSTLVKAVVGWVDLTLPTAVARINYLAQHSKMRGLRPMLQSLPQDDWILNIELTPAIVAMKDTGLSLDALVRVQHLPSLYNFAKRHPTLPIVVDHAGKPDITNSHEFDAWLAAMTAMAELPQVYCKISGLVTEASAEQWVDDFYPYVAQVYRLFGAERLMWGSDWPVVNLATNPRYASYHDWLALAKQLLVMATEAELDSVFEHTARKFYRF